MTVANHEKICLASSGSRDALETSADSRISIIRYAFLLATFSATRTIGVCPLVDLAKRAFIRPFDFRKQISLADANVYVIHVTRSVIVSSGRRRK